VKLALDLTEKWVTVNSRLKDLAKTVKDKVQHRQVLYRYHILIVFYLSF